VGERQDTIQRQALRPGKTCQYHAVEFAKACVFSSHHNDGILQVLPKEAAMTPSRPRSLLLLPLAVATAVVLAVIGFLVPAGASTTSSCGIGWGSQPKVGNGAQPVAGAVLTDVRAGQQACYDRLVLDLRGTADVASWRVQYVDQVRQEASGRPVPLRGGAFLQISAGASDHTAAGTPTYRPADPRELVGVGGFRTFRQVAWAGSFEGVSQIGLGVRGRLPFRVFAVPGIPETANGTRVVIDVAHAW
jgi:hypothetical protein